MIRLLLQKSGALIGLNLEYFFCSGGWIFARYLAVSLSGLVLTIAFTRFSEKETYGQFQFILATIGMISFLSLPGLNTASMKEATRGNFGGVKRSVYLSFLSSLLMVFFGMLVSGWFIWKGDTELGYALLIASGFAPLFYAPNNWYVFYESKLDFRSTTIRIILASVSVVFLTGTLIVLGANIFFIIAASFIVPTLFWWGYFIEATKKFPGKAVGAALDLKYGMSCTVQKFTTTAMNENLPSLVLAVAFGMQGLAVFQVAYFSFSSLSGLFGSLASTYIPLLFKYEKIQFWRIVLQNFLIGAAFVVVYVFTIHFLFLPVFGGNYRESLPLALWLGAIVPLIPVKIFLSSYYSSRNRNGLISLTNVISGLSAAVTLWFFRNDGMLIAAILSFGVMYAIQVVVPLSVYFCTTSKKTDSI